MPQRKYAAVLILALTDAAAAPDAVMIGWLRLCGPRASAACRHRFSVQQVWSFYATNIKMDRRGFALCRLLSAVVCRDERSPQKRESHCDRGDAGAGRAGDR